MEGGNGVRLARSRRPPAWLSECDTAEEDPATLKKYSHASYEKGRIEEQAKSLKRRKIEDVGPNAAALQRSCQTSPKLPSEGLKYHSGQEFSELAEIEEGVSSAEDGGSPELGVVWQLPEEILAKILAKLPSNFLIQASGVSISSISLERALINPLTAVARGMDTTAKCKAQK
jgi:hypothetical protein